MAYLREERETVIHYDELDDCWTFETNVRRHITKIEKRIELYEIPLEEFDDRGRRIYICAKMRQELSVLCETTKKEIAIESILSFKNMARTHFWERETPS
ncbi:hypothetical protein [Streptococcus equi]|uniref:hypothetical protein n=1 Tax=Streptococcus equi TaxID=1336 RepID=UPI001E5A9314|nr:hypothetical protein [Streptococcus equi]